MDFTEQDFLNDVTEHQMIIIRDDGVNRHIRFKRPNTFCMHFDLITWPGNLCYTGDMGTYVFRRLDDMFEFFRTDRERGYMNNGKTLSINLGYWSEKLIAIDHGGVTRFDPDKFRAVVSEYRLSWMRERRIDKESRRELWAAVDDEVLNRADDGEHAAFQAAYDFCHKIDGKEFQFSDFFEHRFTEYTNYFIWCCYALAWGIQKYDQECEVSKANHE
ncbi:hypothetical protein CAP31_03745 [Sulfuriferula sp. AH1]|uniref:hypothetical protein n=1 Tax=Sulfuriferula sp. AH1 TaxID=1985873 RepID=UPI000B3B2E79|nr:hypothetical protein [Sulfuriferula sp. AH1]ARU30875.1 hypothetical protein CAP31_03745 [Sulfuriferula sp. AH1]